MDIQNHSHRAQGGPRRWGRCGIIAGLVAGWLAAAVPVLSAESGAAWRSLFNGRDFEGWDKILAPLPGTDTPLGWNNDPRNVFTIVVTDGAPAIRVSGEIYGALTTKEEVENFHLRLEVKWGDKRWPPRETVARDTGILYCGVGDPNPHTGWLTSVENNIMERGIGQWWSVNGAIIDVEGEFITPAMEPSIPYQKEGDGERNIVYRRGAPRITASPANGITPSFDIERPHGEWNTVEVLFWAGHCIHLLNGRVNMVLTNPRYMRDDREIPLRSGRIQLQSEAAECFYRSIEVRPVDEIPAEYLALIPSWQDNDTGFQPLLSGNAAKQWKECGPGEFGLTNGVATARGGMGLWWYASRPFTNFVLRGEFLQEALTADSGIFVRFADPADDPWAAVKSGHEIEIGDPEPENPTWRTGSVYPLKAAVMANTRPAGWWNQFEVICVGHNYAVRINDRMVTTWTDPDQRSAFGYIGLQNYDDGGTVRFRNLRVKDLP